MTQLPQRTSWKVEVLRLDRDQDLTKKLSGEAAKSRQLGQLATSKPTIQDLPADSQHITPARTAILF